MKDCRDLIAGARNVREYLISFFFMLATHTFPIIISLFIHICSQTDKVGACVELNVRRSRILESKNPLTRRFKYPRIISSKKINLPEIKPCKIFQSFIFERRRMERLKKTKGQIFRNYEALHIPQHLKQEMLQF